MPPRPVFTEFELAMIVSAICFFKAERERIGDKRYPVYQRVSDCLSISLASVKRIATNYKGSEDEDSLETKKEYLSEDGELPKRNLKRNQPPLPTIEKKIKRALKEDNLTEDGAENSRDSLCTPDGLTTDPQPTTSGSDKGPSTLIKEEIKEELILEDYEIIDSAVEETNSDEEESSDNTVEHIANTTTVHNIHNGISNLLRVKGCQLVLELVSRSISSGTYEKGIFYSSARNIFSSVEVCPTSSKQVPAPFETVLCGGGIQVKQEIVEDDIDRLSSVNEPGAVFTTLKSTAVTGNENVIRDTTGQLWKGFSKNVAKMDSLNVVARLKGAVITSSKPANQRNTVVDPVRSSFQVDGQNISSQLLVSPVTIPVPATSTVIIPHDSSATGAPNQQPPLPPLPPLPHVFHGEDLGVFISLKRVPLERRQKTKAKLLRLVNLITELDVDPDEINFSVVTK